MRTAFVDVVEDVKQLSSAEKLELKDLLDNYLIEERRVEMLRYYHESRKNLAEGNLKFSSDADELIAILDD